MILRGSENMLGFMSTSNLNNMHYVMSERKLKGLLSSWEKQEEKLIINHKKTEFLVVSKNRTTQCKSYILEAWKSKRCRNLAIQVV